MLNKISNKPNLSYLKKIHWCYDDKNPSRMNKL